MILTATFDWPAVGDVLVKLVAASVPFFAAWLAYKVKRAERVQSEIHTLVNSQMGDQLFTGMVSAKNLSLSTPTQENIALFRVAERRYVDHQARQAKVDDATAHETQARASGD